MSSSTSSSQKWLELGMKVVVAAITFVPILRSAMHTPNFMGSIIRPYPSKSGSFTLVFMTSEQSSIANVPLDHATANESFVDKHKIQSLARHHRAYAVEIHADKLDVLTRGPCTRQQVIIQIADSLREIGVKIIPNMNAY
ncbi:hypothetical protein [Aliidiomarina quisquiliarum]|uniref:hypothetical protein n=1 Tax=Aliidiomarina quisquiliarum TaxID=2938947 RepID=UPI00208EA8A5|nr:hypothetical protein [Aliidiomarina quisquiliarum]MCO4320966.1 hypothetical protein [Aliidiomarina quisquiliarum]